MLDTDLEFCEKELVEMLAMFGVEDKVRVRHRFTDSGDKFVNTVTVNGNTYAYGNLVRNYDGELERKRYIKRYAKLSLYKALSTAYSKTLPWGALTGIRPTKVAYQELEKGEDFKDLFINTMKVSEAKTLLIEKILKTQRGIYGKNQGITDFFVFIPFCPSRCKYCSFITADLISAKKHVEDYVECLIKEINASKGLIKNLRSIYVGGGTPVALSDENLDKILTCIDDINSGVEYTVEAGRPDRITKSNLEILKRHNVTRICINPQTFNDKTLQTIGRKHTAKDIIEKYQMAKEDFSVNMDLIAGLEGESFEDFKYSLETAINLNPDNITVHTLSVKKGAELDKQGKNLSVSDIEKMVSYAEKRLEESGYNPYYLYRQKYMAGNLENVGYSKAGKECIYNVDVMEEISDNVACGAGSVSKTVDFSLDKIERYGAPKDVITYIQKLDEIIEMKNKLFS